jgi:hypothetical protein
MQITRSQIDLRLLSGTVVANQEQPRQWGIALSLWTSSSTAAAARDQLPQAAH